MLGTLVLLCSASLPPAQCWPSKADAMFAASETELEDVTAAAKRRRIDLRNRYIVVRNISCEPETAAISNEGKGELPGACRDMGTANGHCASPLFRGKCPN